MNNPPATYRPALPSDISTCMAIRGKTRDNPMTVEDLASFGVTEASWSSAVQQGQTIGTVYETDGEIVGYCFGDTQTAEILVLAVLPEFEGQGVGKTLLRDVMEKLFQEGHQRLWLAASPDPAVLANGFYRYLGWQPTGEADIHLDEILVYEKGAS